MEKKGSDVSLFPCILDRPFAGQDGILLSDGDGDDLDSTLPRKRQNRGEKNAEAPRRVKSHPYEGYVPWDKIMVPTLPAPATAHLPVSIEESPSTPVAAESVAPQTNEVSLECSPPVPTGVASPAPSPQSHPIAPVKVTKSSDFIPRRNRLKMIVDIVKEAGGVFPGGENLRLAYKKRARDISPHNTYGATVDKATDDLVNSLKLKRGSFALKNANGTLIEKEVLCLPSVSFSDEIFKACEDAIVSEYPRHYIPAGIELDPQDCIYLDIHVPMNRHVSSVVPRSERARAVKVTSCADSSTTSTLRQSFQMDYRSLSTPAPSYSHNCVTNEPPSSNPLQIEEELRVDSSTNAAHCESFQLDARSFTTPSHVSSQNRLPNESSTSISLQNGAKANALSSVTSSLQKQTHISDWMTRHHPAQRIESSSSTPHLQAQRLTTSSNVNAHERRLASSPQPDQAQKQTYATRSMPPDLQECASVFLHDICGDEILPSSSNASQAKEQANVFSSQAPRVRKLAHASSSNTTHIQEYPLLSSSWPTQTEKEALTINNKHEYKFVMDTLCEPARRQEELRETAIETARLDAQTARLATLVLPNIRHNGWITSMTSAGVDFITIQRGVRRCCSLTHPLSMFYPNTGTFSTEFASFRNVRPMVKVDTELQRLFDDAMPYDTEEILRRQYAHSTATGKDNAQQREIESTIEKLGFEVAIDAVKDWEITNQDMLLSSRSLTTPTFINFVLPSQVKTEGPEPIQAAQPSSANHKINRSPSEAVKSLETSPQDARAVVESVEATKTRKRAPRQPKPNTLDDSRPLKDLEAANMQHFLLATVSVVRALLGGNSKTISWPAISYSMPGFELKHLKYRYYQAQKYQSGLSEKYLKVIEKELMSGFTSGELPVINFDDVLSFEWAETCAWAARKTVSIKDKVSLPASSNTLNNEYDLRGFERSTTPFDYFFNLKSTTADRSMAMEQVPYSRALDHAAAQPVKSRRYVNGAWPEDKAPTEDEIALTFVRANVFTPAEDFDPPTAKSLLDTITPNALTKAVIALKNRGIIASVPPFDVSSPTPRRQFVPDHSVMKFLGKLWPARILHEASSIKLKFDVMLERTPATPLELPDKLTTGETIVFASLVAEGQITSQLIHSPTTSDPFAPGIDTDTNRRRLSVWGVTNGDYRVNRIDQALLSIPMQIIPTTTYTVGSSLSEPLPPPPAPHLAEETRDRRKAFWFSIHDKLMPRWWEAIVAAVLFYIVNGPRMTLDGLTRLMEKHFEPFEIQLVVEWLIRAGAVVWDGTALVAKGTWYMVFGSKN